MQITINIPDNLPPAIIQQQLLEFEEKLNRLLLPANHKTSDRQLIKNIINQAANLPTLDQRTANEILGYEDSAIGLWGDE
jgi:predicted component of type VI protein secretion system